MQYNMVWIVSTIIIYNQRLSLLQLTFKTVQHKDKPILIFFHLNSFQPDRILLLSGYIFVFI